MNVVHKKAIDIVTDDYAQVSIWKRPFALPCQGVQECVGTRREAEYIAP